MFTPPLITFVRCQVGRSRPINYSDPLFMLLAYNLALNVSHRTPTSAPPRVFVLLFCLRYTLFCLKLLLASQRDHALSQNHVLSYFRRRKISPPQTITSWKQFDTMTRGFTTKNVRLGHSAAAYSKRADAGTIPLTHLPAARS